MMLMVVSFYKKCGSFLSEEPLSKRLNVWGNAAQQIGDLGYRDASAT